MTVEAFCCLIKAAKLCLVELGSKGALLSCSGVLVKKILGNSLIDLLNCGLNGFLFVRGIGLDSYVCLFDSSLKGRVCSLIVSGLLSLNLNSLLGRFNIWHGFQLL